MSSSWHPINITIEGEDLASYLDQGAPLALYLPSPGQEGAPTDGVYRLTGRHVLSRGQTLIFGAGARLGAESGGATFVAEGRLVAAPHQHIFEVGSAEARLVVRCLSGSVDQVYPQWWGATYGRGVSDAAAIEAMLSGIEQTGVDTVVFAATSTYLIDRTVTLLPGKRYLGDGAVFQATSSDANPVFAISPVAATRTELIGVRFFGAGQPVTLLRIAPDLADIAAMLRRVLDSELSQPWEAVWPERPGSLSTTDLDRPWLDVPPSPERIVPLSPGDPQFMLTHPAATLIYPHGSVVIVGKCEFRDASIAIATLGAFDGRLVDSDIIACGTGLDLDVVDRRLTVERVSVWPAADGKATEVKVRLRAGRLRLDSVVVDGQLAVEVESGELELRSGRFGFASFTSVPDTTGTVAARVTVVDSVFDGAEIVSTASGAIRAGVYVRHPHAMRFHRTHFRYTGNLARVTGLLVEWDGQRIGSVQVDGCHWEGEPDAARLGGSVALHNIDLRSASELPLSSNRLAVRSGSFAGPFQYALRMDGGNVEFDGCSVETQNAFWVRQSVSNGLVAGQQVLSVRGLTFRPPLEAQAPPSLYAQFEQTASSPLWLILVHEDVLLDAAVNNVSLHGHVDGVGTGANAAGPLPSLVLVGRRVIEGSEATLNGTTAGFAGDLYRPYPPAREPSDPYPRSMRGAPDRVCIRSGLARSSVWVPFCRHAKET